MLTGGSQCPKCWDKLSGVLHDKHNVTPTPVTSVNPITGVGMLYCSHCAFKVEIKSNSN